VEEENEPISVHFSATRRTRKGALRVEPLDNLANSDLLRDSAEKYVALVKPIAATSESSELQPVWLSQFF
jgi:hypothetical protein